MVHTVYFSVAILIGIVFFLLAIHAALNWSVEGARVLVVIMLAAASYAVAYIFQMNSLDLASAIFWYNLSLPGANLVAPAWLVFVLMWVEQVKVLTRRHYLLLGLIPALVCLAAWTNPFHHLYGANFRFAPQNPWAVLEWDFGLWYWVGFTYAYGIIAVTVVILLNAARRHLRIFLNQTLLLLLGVLVPVITNLLFNLGITPVPKMDVTPFTFLFTGVTWSLAFFGFRVLNIVPMAHERVFRSMPIGMLVLDSMGRVVDTNPAAREMLGISEKKLKSRELPSSLAETFSRATLSSVTEESSEIVYLELKSGPRYLDIHLTPFFDRDWKLAGTLLLLNDITSQKLTEAALRESENKLRSLFAAMSDVILVLDIDGVYLEVAPTDPAEYYRSQTELLGKKVSELYSPEQARFFLNYIRGALAVGKLTGVEYSLRIGEKDLWFSANITALTPRTVLWVARDITDRKIIEKAIQKSEAGLRQAQAIAHLGSWEIDLATRLIWASDEAMHIYGLEPGSPIPLDKIQGLTLADERERMDMAFGVLLEGQETYDEEYHILRADNDLPRTLHAIASLVCDRQGQPAKIFGIIQDITERKMAEKELLEKDKRYRSVVQSAKDAILTADANGKLISWNQGAQNIFQYTEAEIVGRSLTLLIPERFRESFMDGMRVIGSGQEAHHLGQSMRVVGRRKDGTEFPVELVLSSWNEEERIFFTGIIRDITERLRLDETLKYQSTHDALTGLFNRQYYESEIELLQKGNHYPISMLMMDVDGLKRVNDLQGHHAGDELLQQIARVLQATFRPQDMIARIGGDEFVVILPDMDALVAIQVVQRLNDNMKVHNLSHPTSQALSLSIGMACGKKGTLLSDVFNQADRAMYSDKAERKEQTG
jgi:diguanylate cyclase (GGDEF)-like protein/PAS domain S-box-containing protein